MMNPMPDPPYKISRNFKLQSCAPNVHVNRETNKGVKFVLLEKTIKQRSLTEQARHKSNMTCNGAPCSGRRCSTRHIGEVKSLTVNPVDLPAIWGWSGGWENRVSMMSSMPDPPHEIGCRRWPKHVTCWPCATENGDN